MNYRQFSVGYLPTNCYVVWAGHEAGVIDPGGPTGEIIAFVKNMGLTLQWIVNTHGHADHIEGNRELHTEFKAPILIHEADRKMLLFAEANLSAFFGAGITSPDASSTLKNGDRLILGNEYLTVIETPGHTPGGISLYTQGLLFSGDALFYESVGRTDFPGGSFEMLIRCIKERLLVLPPETVVLPGHNEETTIAHEIEANPFLMAD